MHEKDEREVEKEKKLQKIMMINGHTHTHTPIHKDKQEIFHSTEDEALLPCWFVGHKSYFSYPEGVKTGEFSARDGLDKNVNERGY